MKKDMMRELGGKTASEMSTQELINTINHWFEAAPLEVLNELRKRAGDDGEPLRHNFECDFDMLDEWCMELGYSLDESGSYVRDVIMTDDEVDEWMLDRIRAKKEG